MTNNSKPATASIDLDFPIDLENGSQIAKLTLKRPKTKTVKKLMLAYGPVLAEALMGNEGAPPVDDNSTEAVEDSFSRADMASLLKQLVTSSGIDTLTEVLGDLTGLPPEQVDEIDPEDYPKIGAGLAGFFPQLISLLGTDGDKPPAT